MGKKIVENEYGVQVGSLFERSHSNEDESYYDFYQVVALRGKTQVVVREIGAELIAFDGNYEGYRPVLDAWVGEDFIRKVQKGESQCSNSEFICISVGSGQIGSFAFLVKNPKEFFLTYSGSKNFSYYLREYNPEIARQLDLRKGSGVYAIDKPMQLKTDDCCALIRYPDGKEQEVMLRELLHYEEEKRYMEWLNSEEMAQKREKMLDEWMKSEEGRKIFHE